MWLTLSLLLVVMASASFRSEVRAQEVTLLSRFKWCTLEEQCLRSFGGWDIFGGGDIFCGLVHRNSSTISLVSRWY